MSIAFGAPSGGWPSFDDDGHRVDHLTVDGPEAAQASNRQEPDIDIDRALGNQACGVTDVDVLAGIAAELYRRGNSYARVAWFMGCSVQRAASLVDRALTIQSQGAT